MIDKLFNFTESEEVAISNACRQSAEYMRNFGKGETPNKSPIGSVFIKRTVVWKSLKELQRQFPTITQEMLNAWDVRRKANMQLYDYYDVKRHYIDMQDRLRIELNGWVLPKDILAYGINMQMVRFATAMNMIRTKYDKNTKRTMYDYTDIERVMRQYSFSQIMDMYIKSKNISRENAYGN